MMKASTVDIQMDHNMLLYIELQHLISGCRIPETKEMTRFRFVRE